MLRKFICLSAGLAACGIAGTAQAAPKEWQPAPVAQERDPIAIAQLFPDGTIGEWRPYLEADGLTCRNPGFDAFEATTDGNNPCGFAVGQPTDGADQGGFDPYCDPAGLGGCDGAGYRWYGGSQYVQSGRRSSGVSATANPGGVDNVCRLQLSWFETLESGQIDPNGNTVGDTIIVINTYDGQFDQNCDPNGQVPNSLGGVVLNFGPPTAVSGWYSNVDLAANQIAMTVPSGEFGHDMLFFYDTGLNQIAANNQPFAWGPKDADLQGVNGDVIYDDDNWDGEFDPVAECFSAVGTCPVLLSSMVGFYTEGEAPCQTFSVNRLVGGQPSTFSVESPDNPNAQFGVIYFLNEAQGLAFADCVNNAGSNALGELVQCYGGDPRDTLACQGTLNGSGEGTCSTPVPQAARGRTVTFVSVVRTTDGWCASSFTQTVQ